MKDVQTVITGGVLAVLILREVFAFLKTRKSNGSNGKEHAELLADLDAIREDTRTIRQGMHTVINGLSAMKGATEILLSRLERDRR